MWMCAGMLAKSNIVVGGMTNNCWQNHISMLAESQINVGRITYYYWQNHK